MAAASNGLDFFRNITYPLFTFIEIVLNIFARTINAPVCRLEQSGQHSDGGYLAGSVGPQIAQDFRRFHLKTDIINSRKNLIFFGDPP
jgi:hypothetical protein